MAPLRFTRAMVSPFDSTTNKDAPCVAEFGSSYQAASGLDLAALYQTMTNSGYSILSDYTSSMYVYGSGSYYYSYMAASLSYGSSGAASVACSRR